MTKSKVVVIRCEDYNRELIYKLMTKGIEELGGISSFIKKDEKILVKPNFLYPSDKDKAIITHPDVISAVLRILKDNGYENVLVGDSPANGDCLSAINKAEISDEMLYGARIAPMNEEVLVKIAKPVIASKLYLTKEAYEADAIIGVSKMKTHMLERITGAVKNMYGLVCGKRKAQGHVSYKNAVDFAKMLCDIHLNTKQKLHIIDGIVAMEGNGPGSGTPVKMGVILLSKDPIALDSIFARLINLKPEYVPTITQGYINGLGNYKDVETILLDEELKTTAISISDLIKRFGKMDFDVQRDKEKFSFLTLLSHLSGGGKKPRIDVNKCIKCGVCVNHCPVDGKAITFKNGKDKPPVYNYQKCIRCYCCQELCPQKAISVK